MTFGRPSPLKQYNILYRALSYIIAITVIAGEARRATR